MIYNQKQKILQKTKILHGDSQSNVTNRLMSIATAVHIP